MTALMTVDEVAALLALERETVWSLGREGALRFAVIRIGGPRGRMRFRRDLVEHWIEAGGPLQPAGAA
jgi:excisionase family DNA binding protein